MKIIIASPIYKESVEKLRDKHEVVLITNGDQKGLLTEIENADAIILRSGVALTKNLIEKARKLKLVIRAGSGLDNIDLAVLKEKSVKLYRIPKPGARAVGELAFAMMLSLSRDLINANSLTSKGVWAKHELEGQNLHKKVLGIIGAGNIGSTVGSMGYSWGMKVYGCVEKPNKSTRNKLKKMGIELATLEKVVRRADFISVHVPLQTSTINLIDKKTINLMKPGSILINLSRGEVVDEIDLLTALKSGRIKAAALDVHQKEGNGQISPLAGLPNVILTPHIGSQTIDAQKEIGAEIIKIINKHANQK